MAVYVLKRGKIPYPLTILDHSQFCFQEFQPKRRKYSERRKNHMPELSFELSKISLNYLFRINYN